MRSIVAKIYCKNARPLRYTEHMDNRLVGYACGRPNNPATDRRTESRRLRRDLRKTLQRYVEERAGLDACLEPLAPGDALVVVGLDGIGRSASHVIATVATLRQTANVAGKPPGRRDSRPPGRDFGPLDA
jgi:hypothetical protein